MRCRKGGHAWISFRSLKRVDTNTLIADLKRIPWSILDINSNDPDEMLYTWNKLVLDVIDSHAPVKKRRVKTRDKSSCLTSEILEAIKHRDHLKKLFEQGKIPRGTCNKARTKVVRNYDIQSQVAGN